MKTKICLIGMALLAFASTTFASEPRGKPADNRGSSVVLSGAPAFEVKGRTGSKRVGGRNGKGKGSHYVGGRK